MTISGIETCFIARVGTDVEVKTSQAGKPWANFRACVGSEKDGEEQQQWLQIVMFGSRASSLTIVKGDKIYVEGRLKLEGWTGRDGVERQGLKVAAWRIERLGEIGKNKPAKPAKDDAPANEQRVAHSQPNGGRQSGTPARDWQRPPADDPDSIPF